MTVRVATSTTPPDDAEVACVAAAPDGHTAVEYLEKGASLDVGGVWEFVPYNDAFLASRITDSFIKKVDALRSKLLSASDQTRKKALHALRDFYDETFKDVPLQRNRISLFLYANFSARLLARTSSFKYVVEAFDRRWSHWSYAYRPVSRASRGHEKTGLIYTGDGYLDKPERMDEFESYLSPVRLGGTSVLQVMHHGAETNWHKGVSTRLSPAWSVFSSDPLHRHGHPHAAVLRDFWRFEPVQVDKTRGIVFDYTVAADL